MLYGDVLFMCRMLLESTTNEHISNSDVPSSMQIRV